ncbi:hypothetical protein M011DRAFT_472683 [Sporormia fimetaria CBS 119925]|uniref:Uncharacterized protein n=1 Tax=Sporormia fimetaria CBS 119925 TaxID=1340428 RepID=A0A6A6UUV6_9PLEO|nr:hypothetical protein M011DRAFT_472683 [Sporormia fimetaria CBS 119925]
MPTDRSNTNINGRPLKPTLASTRTAAKSAPGIPITPRLAPSIASANSSQIGRPVRLAGSSSKLNATPQDDRAPVNKPGLNHNITPRSSARRSRVGLDSPTSTPSLTPSATPNSSRPPSTIDIPSRGGYAISGHASQHTPSVSRPMSLVGGNQYHASPASRSQLGSAQSTPAVAESGGRTRSPKFFHASEARPHEPRSHEPAQPSKKAPVFFYANGHQDGSTSSSDLPSPPLSAAGRAPESKFFHVDSITEPKGQSPLLTPSSITAKVEPLTNAHSQQKSPGFRSASPPRENTHLPYRKGANQPARPSLNTRTSLHSLASGVSGVSQGPTLDAEPHETRRRSSMASSVVRLGHAKSASLSSIDSVASFRKSQQSEVHPIAPSPLHHQNRVVSNESLPDSVASGSVVAEALSGLPSPAGASPVKSTGGQSTVEHINELAANARRERKVLDLEISNSSLLAINRQLEREVRKQKAELRRFRRMSRAGRFSSDSRVPSYPESLSAVGQGDIGNLSEMSEEEVIEEDEPEYSSESSFDEGVMSPTALAERDADHRLRDEKRLQLDLTKHRELLLDSQKMNQSLKRCMDWTEMLIKDAQKALAYEVKASDVKLGGRVLTTEEHPELEHDEEHKALLSPWSPGPGSTDYLDGGPLTSSMRTDRDSGVEVDGLKLAALETSIGTLSAEGSTPQSP